MISSEEIERATVLGLAVLYLDADGLEPEDLDEQAFEDLLIKTTDAYHHFSDTPRLEAFVRRVLEAL